MVWLSHQYIAERAINCAFRHGTQAQKPLIIQKFLDGVLITQEHRVKQNRLKLQIGAEAPESIPAEYPAATDSLLTSQKSGHSVQDSRDGEQW
jgi:hypothetical protein